MANENLIFRKGLQANLADTSKCPIKPGAISITIDEPGMYIDLPANAALGHANDYRIRIGDVISVYGLQDLAALAANDQITADKLSTESATSTNTLQGKINRYSSSALYYVLEQNMLLKYNVATEKFIWINDTSKLQQDIAALGITVGEHTTAIEDLETKVGSANTNAAGQTSNATGLYKVIEETAADLEDQIAGILGGGDGLTLESLNKAIQDEAKARSDSDTTITGNITNLTSRVETAEGNITGINNLIGEATSTNTSTVFGKINAEKTRAEGAESGLSNRIKAIEDLKIEETYATQVDLTGVTTTLGTLQGTVSDLTTTVGNNKTAIEQALANEQSRAEGVESGLDDRIKAIENLKINETYATKTSVTNLSGRVDGVVSSIGDADDAVGDPTVYGAIKSEVDRATKAEQALQGRVGALETAAPTYALKTELAPVATQASDNATAITGIQSTLESSYYKKTQVYTKTEVDSLIDGAEDKAAQALTDAKAYTDAREDAIIAAYEADDAALELKITGIQTTLESVATDDELAEAVQDLTADIATAKAKAITDATAAAKTYTDNRETAITTAYQAADEVLNTAITGLSTSKANAADVYTKTEINNTVQGINSAITTQETTLKAYADQAEADAKAHANTEIGKVNEALTQHVNAAEKNYETKEDATAKLNAAKADATEKANAAKSGAVADAKTYTNDEIAKEAKLRKDGDDALDVKIQGVSTNLTNNYYTSAQIDAKNFATETYADTAAANAVKNVLRAAEAMRYMGTLTTGNPLTEAKGKTGTQAGDVWVVASISNDGAYHPGDMLIANKDNATADADWTHVQTGYDARLEQKLFTAATTNGGTITLDSIGTLDTGSIEIKADLNSAVRVTMTTDNTTAGNHGVATIGMVWEDF